MVVQGNQRASSLGQGAPVQIIWSLSRHTGQGSTGLAGHTGSSQELACVPTGGLIWGSPMQAVVAVATPSEDNRLSRAECVTTAVCLPYTAELAQNAHWQVEEPLHLQPQPPPFSPP